VSLRVVGRVLRTVEKEEKRSKTARKEEKRRLKQA